MTVAYTYICVYIAHSNYVYMHKNSTGGFVRYVCPVCRYSNLLCTIATVYHSFVCVFSENEQFDKLSEVIPVVLVAVVYMYMYVQLNMYSLPVQRTYSNPQSYNYVATPPPQRALLTPRYGP